VEYRRAKINDRPPPESVSGDLYNLTSAGPTLGSDSTWEAYGEVEAPIVRDAPFIKDLTLNVSGRYTDYRSYGSDWTYKVGGVWSPNDWISFRATYGTSFRAPALFEQFQGGTTGFLSQQTDPCNEYGTPGTPANIAANCAKELPGQPNFLQTQSVTVVTKGGAGSGLKAETSKNLTVGTIFRPKLPELFGQLDIALDYFDILIENGVSQLPASTILDLCYSDPNFQNGQGYCRFVARDAGTGALTVDQDYVNVAQFKTKGYDFNLRWQDDIGPGRVLINVGVTRYMTQATKNFSDADYTEYNGTIGVPKWAGSLDAQYRWTNWTFNYGVDWVGGGKSYDFLGATPADGYKLDTPDYFVHRLSVQYKSDADWAITAGVRNLFDETPPTISGATGYYDRVGNAPLYSEYDYYGRRYFVTVSKQF
jgi:outer membrane receptor protein involved in Fe transport